VSTIPDRWLFRSANGTDKTRGVREWFAVQVLRGNFERRVRDQLRLSLIEEFLPLYTVRSRWSDRVKLIERPLFPGYLFARVDAAAGGLAKVLELRPQIALLPSNLAPAAVPDEQVETIAKLCYSELPLLPAEYKRGQAVTIQRGALAGVSGIVSKVRNRYRLTVNVDIFRRAVEVELDAEAVAGL
jgi:transcriptional antiterminator NusG